MGDRIQEEAWPIVSDSKYSIVHEGWKQAIETQDLQ